MPLLVNPECTMRYLISNPPDDRGNCVAHSNERNEDGNFIAGSMVDLKICLLDEARRIPQDLLVQLSRLSLVQGRGEHVVPYLEAFSFHKWFVVVFPSMPTVAPHFLSVNGEGGVSTSPLRGPLSEPEGRVVLSHMLENIQYLHERGFAVFGLSFADLRMNNNRIVFDVMGKLWPIPPPDVCEHPPIQSLPKDALSLMPPEVFFNLPHEPRQRDLWVVLSIFAIFMVGHRLYELPHQGDCRFRLFIMDGFSALSSDTIDERTRATIRDFSPEAFRRVVPTLWVMMNFSTDLIDLLCAALALNYSDRCNIEQVMQSNFFAHDAN
jgi:serine/threonine protein kinase